MNNCTPLVNGLEGKLSGARFQLKNCDAHAVTLWNNSCTPIMSCKQSLLMTNDRLYI